MMRLLSNRLNFRRRRYFCLFFWLVNCPCFCSSLRSFDNEGPKPNPPAVVIPSVRKTSESSPGNLDYDGKLEFFWATQCFQKLSSSPVRRRWRTGRWDGKSRIGYQTSFIPSENWHGSYQSGTAHFYTRTTLLARNVRGLFRPPRLVYQVCLKICKIVGFLTELSVSQTWRTQETGWCKWSSGTYRRTTRVGRVP